MAKRPASAREGPRKRRDEVLRAATEMFYERGYEATTTREITDRLGLLKGSLYYYIDTKEELLFLVMEQTLEAGIASLQAWMDSSDSPVEKLAQFVQHHVVFLSENLMGAALVLHEQRSLTDAHREVIAAQLVQYEDGVRKLIEAGQADGSFQAELDPHIAAFGVLGMVNWLYRWYRPGGPATPEEIGRHLAALVVDGLAARPKPKAGAAPRSRKR